MLYRIIILLLLLLTATLIKAQGFEKESPSFLFNTELQIMRMYQGTQMRLKARNKNAYEHSLVYENKESNVLVAFFFNQLEVEKTVWSYPYSELTNMIKYFNSVAEKQDKNSWRIYGRLFDTDISLERHKGRFLITYTIGSAHFFEIQ